MSSLATRPAWRLALGLTAVALLLGACQDYVTHRDKIAFHAGESGAYNRAVHVIDPWPAGSRRTDLEHDGRRMMRVIERYESGELTLAPSGGGAPGALGAPASPPP